MQKMGKQLPQKFVDLILDKTKPKTDLEGPAYKMSNMLTRSAQNLTLTEKRIMGLALAAVNQHEHATGIHARYGTLAIPINAKQYAARWGIHPKQAYDDIKNGLKTLMTRTWRLVEKPRPGHERITTGHWISHHVHTPGNAEWEIHIHALVAPHVTGLLSHFTKVPLEHTKAIQSIFAWRLMECLKSYGTTGEWHVNTTQFQDIMEVPNESRQTFGHTNQEIKRAVARLAKQGWNIQMKFTKTGRNITTLHFRFNHPQHELDEQTNINQENT